MIVIRASITYGVTPAPWEVPMLEIQEYPPSTLRNIDGGPPGGC
jgi:hypothetical protein